jgi:DNA-binding CsgD family transcriptional regulator
VTGMTDKQIGDVLAISPRTVQSHVASALRKTETSRRTELMALAMASGALD